MSIAETLPPAQHLTSLGPARSDTIRILVHPKPGQSTNPYVRLLYEQVDKHGHALVPYRFRNALQANDDAIIHIQWPERLLSGDGLSDFVDNALFRLGLAIAKFRGARILWTVHNVEPHDKNHRWLHRRRFDWFSRRVDAICVLSETGLEAVRAAYPSTKSKPAFLLPHGHYRDAYPNAVSKSQARSELEIPEKSTVLLNFGKLRPYKGVDRLLDVFTTHAPHDWILLIAGSPDDEIVVKSVEEATQYDSRIRATPRFILEDEVQIFFNAADAVVLPFEQIMHSGSAMLALSFNRPVVVPNQGSMEELAHAVGVDWVHLYDGVFSSSVLESIHGIISTSRADATTVPLDPFDWDDIGDRLECIYRSIAS